MLLHTTPGRFAWTLLVAFLLSSNLNWALAELLLNPWAMPLFDGFMREGENAARGINIVRMTVGFLLPQFVAAYLWAALPRPGGWAARAALAALLVGLAAFFGTYTFLSGWGNVNWYPLMGAAVADTTCVLIGTLLAALLQRNAAQPPATAPTIR
jgi:hypothetical protein